MTEPIGAGASTEETLRQYLRRATAEVHQARTELAADRARRHEPIAILGMACRFPGGVTTPAELWQLIETGQDAIGEFPSDRGWPNDLWDPDPDHAGHSTTRHGGFLTDVAGFDHSFFGIPAREAAAIDPQQRLLLELSWEAIERAGLDPTSLAESNTGVFAGIMYGDYGARVRPAPREYEGYLVQGSAGSIASGRVAYHLGLRGPAITIDTACSSSLVSIQLACQSLRQADCDLALAGGATVMATPDTFVEFSRQRGLALDGRCKSFAADADGTGWGEGAGLLVLQRLSDARKQGRPVLAVIRGGALNSDGASSQLSAPNGQAQQEVIRLALRAAGLGPADVDLIEAHGTGTRLGDPIEASALQAVYGSVPRPHGPAGLGSLKSNVGHTQAAAGVGAVIKTVYALRTGIQPRSLHAEQPSEMVDWSSGGLELLTASRDWPAIDRPRRAAVSSFGISGTNAHLILEEYPETGTGRAAKPTAATVPILLSARTAGALRARARRLHDWVAERPELRPDEVGASLLRSRPIRLDHRSVSVVDNRDDLLEQLRALAEAAEAGSSVHGRTGDGTGRVAFVYPGQGSQWAGMAQQLLEVGGTFATRMHECDDALTPLLGWSVLDLAAARDADLTSATQVQPVLFAMMLALTSAWGDFGVQPQAVIGHSQGEIAAAAVAGVLSLDDAARVVALRSQALTKLTGLGGMMSVLASATRTEQLIAELPPGLVIAAYNGPRSTVVSGPDPLLDQLAELARQYSLDQRRIAVDYASHHPDVDLIADDVRRLLAGITPREPAIPMFSTVSQRWVEGRELGAQYWLDNLRLPVRFATSVAQLAAEGFGTFIEPSPHPILTSSISGVLDEHDPAPVVLPTLRREEGGPRQFLLAAGRLHVGGARVEWPQGEAAMVELPTYPFQHERHWIAPSRGGAGLTGTGLAALDHPLLSASLALADGRLVWTGSLTTSRQPWLGEHRVAGRIWLPGAAFADLALLAAAKTGLSEVSELILDRPLELLEDQACQLQLVIEPSAGGDAAELTWFGRRTDDAEWVRHGRGRLGAGRPAPEQLARRPAEAVAIDLTDFYDTVAEAGYEYGPSRQCLRRAWRDEADERRYAEIELPDPGDGSGTWQLHPALLDAALHLLLADSADRHRLRIPFAWSGLRLFATGATAAQVFAVRLGTDEYALELADRRGRLIAVVDSVSLRPLDESEAGASLVLGRFWQSVPDVDPILNRDLASQNLLPDEMPSGDPVLACHRAAEHVRVVVQRWLSEHADDGRMLILQGPRASSMPGARLAAATAAGLVRSAQTEHPGRFQLQWLPSGEADRTAAGADEPELRWTSTGWQAPRLRRFGPADRLSPPAGVSSWRLDIGRRGTIDNLEFHPTDAVDRPLGPREVRVSVRVAGLNFRDVLICLGMYPGSEVEIGGEACGTVLATGTDVTTVQTGQRVTGLFPGGAAGPVAVTDERLLIEAPDGWDDAQAATIPVVFLTARYGLDRLGHLAAGDRLLIHAATGGVGTAAIQLARHAGAEVFATASPAKWPTLRALGLNDDHIGTSRETSFEQKFGSVDVVLNALAGEFTDASLRMLGPQGRMLEMGKTDVRDPEQLALHHPGVEYHAYDLLQAGPDLIAELFAEIAELIEDGALTPLPVDPWPIDQARHAVRWLSQARHVGKLALTLPPRITGTVLITGGTGTLGRVVARHLVERHAAHRIVLCSRRGPDAPGIAAFVAELAALGAQVEVTACDVADRAQLSRVVAGLPDLGVVVHATGVLCDATVTALSAEQLTKVLRAKLDGAWHLHELTAERPVTAFVLFSSLAGTVGTAGQANYAAANSGLDELARVRQEAGLPATAMVWGLWQDASGMTGHLDESDRARLRQLGLAPISSCDALALLDRALNSAEPVSYPVPLDPVGADPDGPPLLSGLRPRLRTALPSATNAVAGLAELTTEERSEQLRQLVGQELGSALGAADDQLDLRQPFKQLGVDSLIAVEFRNRLAAALGRRLPATMVFDYPTPDAVHRYLCDLFGADRAPSPDRGSPVEQLRTDLDRLGEAGKADLLRQLELLLETHRRSSDGAGADLSEATDDELLDVLQNELGIS